jgi:MYXO-CTERM domain-containing protein
MPGGVPAIDILIQETLLMRACMFAPALIAALAASARAHGPQIQITNDDNKIITRNLILEEPYSAALTPPTSVYVMPLLEFDGTWYSRPNNTPSATIPRAPQYPSGPGLAYGYDMVDGGPQAFAEASVLTTTFTDGLKRWDGASFVDAEATQLNAFRGSNVNISTPPENFAITSDVAPFDSVSLAPLPANYTVGAHSSLRFALLGDGTSPTSGSPDSVYLLSLRLSSSQAGLNPSDPYYFVLNKNAPASQVVAAVRSLGIAPSAVQWVVPEPSGLAVALIGLLGFAQVRRRWSQTAKG